MKETPESYLVKSFSLGNLPQVTSARALWLIRRVLSYAAPGVLAVFLALASLSAQTFMDDFNDGNDEGWTRYDLTSYLNDSVGVPGIWANYNFPDDGAGGKAFQIDAMAHPAASDQLLPRAIAYRPEVYSRFKIGVDVLEWDVGAINSFGPIVRTSTIGVGTTGGYLINLNPSNRDLDITRIVGEASERILQTVDATLTLEQGPYRFEVLGSEDALVAHIYQLSDPRAPVISSAVIDETYISGVVGLFVLDFNDIDSWTGAKVTYDNYAAEPLPENTSPQIVFLQPGHLQVAAEVPATVRVSLFDVEATVNVVHSSIRLEVDGVLIPNSALTLTPELYLNRGLTTLEGLTVAYTPASAPESLAGVHTNKFSFQDTAGNNVSTEWVYTYPVLPPENALPSGIGENPGFSVRLVQSDQETANTLVRAEQQLASPPEIPISLETNTMISVINYTQQAVPNTTPDGYFADKATFPGIDPAGNTDDMAMEILFYLELPVGLHRFGVRSDDGFQLRSGATPTDPNAVVLAEQPSGTYDGTFDWVVEQEGIYPFRMVWFERGGGAHVELFTQDPDTDVRTLINDSQSGIRAYQSVAMATLVLESAPSVTGAFAAEASASIDTEAQQISVPVNGDTRYFRLSGGTALRISTVALQEGSVVMTYETAD